MTVRGIHPSIFSTFSLKNSMALKKSLFCFSFFLFCAVACVHRDHSQPSANDEGIPVGSMEDAGLDSMTIKKIDTAIRNGTYPNIHSLLIAVDNKMVYEQYWPGKDESWGKDMGITQHGMDSLHDIRSISKSFVSACIGIAMHQGKIK